MTPYRERREKGYYSPTGETPASTTLASLGGLGTAAPEAEDPEALTKSQLIVRARELGVTPANAAMSRSDLIAAVKGAQ